LSQGKRQREPLAGEEGVPTVGQRTDGEQPIDPAHRELVAAKPPALRCPE